MSITATSNRVKIKSQQILGIGREGRYLYYEKRKDSCQIKQSLSRPGRYCKIFVRSTFG